MELKNMLKRIKYQESNRVEVSCEPCLSACCPAPTRGSVPMSQIVLNFLHNSRAARLWLSSIKRQCYSLKASPPSGCPTLLEARRRSIKVLTQPEQDNFAASILSALFVCVYQKTSSYGRGNKIKRGGNDIHRKQNKIMTIMIIKRDKKREKAVLNPLFYKSPEVSARKIIYFFCQGSVSCTISWPPLPTASRMAASAAL